MVWTRSGTFGSGRLVVTTGGGEAVVDETVVGAAVVGATVEAGIVVRGALVIGVSVPSLQ